MSPSGGVLPLVCRTMAEQLSILFLMKRTFPPAPVYKHPVRTSSRLYVLSPQVSGIGLSVFN